MTYPTAFMLASASQAMREESQIDHNRMDIVNLTPLFVYIEQ